MFGSDLERFGTFYMQIVAKRLRFGARMHCLGVTIFGMGLSLWTLPINSLRP